MSVTCYCLAALHPIRSLEHQAGPPVRHVPQASSPTPPLPSERLEPHRLLQSQRI
ncbi:hypothetical protein IG631_04824 [Alternaria alternata]|nr:hypothetical protein IG631_04824 [Alternaria alternata]